MSDGIYLPTKGRAVRIEYFRKLPESETVALVRIQGRNAQLLYHQEILSGRPYTDKRPVLFIDTNRDFFTVEGLGVAVIVKDDPEIDSDFADLTKALQGKKNKAFRQSMNRMYSCTMDEMRSTHMMFTLMRTDTPYWDERAEDVTGLKQYSDPMLPLHKPVQGAHLSTRIFLNPKHNALYWQNSFDTNKDGKPDTYIYSAAYFKPKPFQLQSFQLPRVIQQETTVAEAMMHIKTADSDRPLDQLISIRSDIVKPLKKKGKKN